MEYESSYWHGDPKHVKKSPDLAVELKNDQICWNKERCTNENEHNLKFLQVEKK